MPLEMMRLLRFFPGCSILGAGSSCLGAFEVGSGDDAARRVLAEMQHLGAGIDLLVRIGDGDRVEFAARVVAAQDAARIFPGDGRASLELGPGNLRVLTAAIAAPGDEI